MITIKKYGNRRLYDTSRSAYVNLEELAEIVRSGQDVEVVDAKTGEDLTREILLQIVLDVLRGSEFFPTGMLRRIIRASGDDPAQRLLRNQLSVGLELMSEQLDRLEALIPSAGVDSPPWPGAAWPGFPGSGAHRDPRPGHRDASRSTRRGPHADDRDPSHPGRRNDPTSGRSHSGPPADDRDAVPDAGPARAPRRGRRAGSPGTPRAGEPERPADRAETRREPSGRSAGRMGDTDGSVHGGTSSPEPQRPPPGDGYSYPPPDDEPRGFEYDIPEPEDPELAALRARLEELERRLGRS